MMLQISNPETLSHVAAKMGKGNAADKMIPKERFQDAISEIQSWDGYEATPLFKLKHLATLLNINSIHYKHEGPRFNLGSFKALGGSYAALQVLVRELSDRLGKQVQPEDIRKGKYAAEVSNITLVSATDGNHGRSLAWGCQQFQAPCRIYIHAEVSENRAKAMSDLGATVIRIQGDYDESVRLARQEAEENGWFVVSDTSWEGYTEPPKDVMAGYGVMTHEICAELSSPPTHVFLQGGVGGLAASVAAYFRQHWQDQSPKVVIVEPELSACLFESAKSGHVKKVDIEKETLMAGLSCGEPSPIAWAILHEEASDFLTLPESAVGPAVRLLARPLGGDPSIEAGESAVAGLAALIMASNHNELRSKLGLNEQSSVLLIGSEGITDPLVYQQLVSEVVNA